MATLRECLEQAKEEGAELAKMSTNNSDYSAGVVYYPPTMTNFATFKHLDKVEGGYKLSNSYNKRDAITNAIPIDQAIEEAK
jgi:hypothetical protein